MTKNDKMMQGYEDLAKCVVAEACNEYVQLACDNYKGVHNRELRQLEKFFMSSRCYLYCEIDGDTILNHLRIRIKEKLNGQE